MSEQEYQEESSEDNMDNRPAPRQYEIVMKGVNPKDREKHVTYGYLGLNPGFVLIQSSEGVMTFAAEWSSVWTVKATPESPVLSLVSH